MTELNPIALALPTSSTSGAAASAAEGLADNFDTFLTLLTEQLQNQDPLDPMDSEQFVAQLVDFTAVEQQIASNQSLETLLELQSADARMSATDWVGRDVTVSSDLNALQGGSARWEYALSREAQSSQLMITDAEGRLVTTLQGETGAGAHTLTWDGRDNAGNQMPDGVYRLEVVATDADEVRIDSATRVNGRVTGVDLSGTDVLVELGQLIVPSGRVIGVRDAQAGA